MAYQLFPVAVLFSSFAVIEDGRWKPGIGDPTAMGWVTTIAYLVAAFFCLRSSFTVPRNTVPLDITKHRVFWVTLSGAMLLLAVNKQLDLQMWFWLTGRNIIIEMEWSHYRRPLQIASMITIAMIACAGLACFVWFTRGNDRGALIALTGVVFTVVFVIIRAMSQHHIDIVLGWSAVGVSVNWFLENGGILLVIVGAFQTARASRMVSANA